MTNLSPDQMKKISFALAKFNEATQELAAILEETDYTLESAPECFEDINDFAYDIASMTEEELEELNDNSVTTEENKELVLA